MSAPRRMTGDAKWSHGLSMYTQYSGTTKILQRIIVHYKKSTSKRQNGIVIENALIIGEPAYVKDLQTYLHCMYHDHNMDKEVDATRRQAIINYIATYRNSYVTKGIKFQASEKYFELMRKESDISKTRRKKSKKKKSKAGGKEEESKVNDNVNEDNVDELNTKSDKVTENNAPVIKKNKNKTNSDSDNSDVAEDNTKKKQSRVDNAPVSKKRKNRKKKKKKKKTNSDTDSDNSDNSDTLPEKKKVSRGPGRPPGSKNKAQKIHGSKDGSISTTTTTTTTITPAFHLHFLTVSTEMQKHELQFTVSNEVYISESFAIKKLMTFSSAKTILYKIVLVTIV
jgi:hypothetical protein